MKKEEEFDAVKSITFLGEKIVFSAVYIDDFTAGRDEPDHTGWYFNLAECPIWLRKDADLMGIFTTQEGAFLEGMAREMFVNEENARRRILDFLMSRIRTIQARKTRHETGFSLFEAESEIVEEMGGTIEEDGTFFVTVDDEKIYYRFVKDKLATKKEEIEVVEDRREKINPPEPVICPVCGKSSTDPTKKMMVAMFGHCGCQKQK